MRIEIDLYNIGRLAPREETTRCWLRPGHSLPIGPDCLLALETERHGDHYDVELILFGAYGIPHKTHLEPIDARPFAQVCVVPKAVEYRDGRPERVLLELISMRLRGVA